jgi:hypothetical protein
MRATLLFIFLFFAQISIAGQGIDQAQQSEQLKTAVQGIAGGSKTRARVTLPDLTEVEGDVLLSSDPLYFFIVEPAKKKAPRAMIPIAYKDVLELEGKETFISFFPDAETRSFGSWETVRQLQIGEAVVIEFEGKTSKGVFYGATDSKLSIMSGNDKIDFEREKTIRVFRLGEHAGTKTEKVLKGAAKGVRVADKVAKTASSILGQGPRPASITGKAIGAAVGAGIAAVKRERQKRLLIFAN